MLAMNRGEYTIAKPPFLPLLVYLLLAFVMNNKAYEVRPGLIKTDMTIPATAYYDELIAKGLVPWDVGVILLILLPPSARWRKVN